MSAAIYRKALKAENIAADAGDVVSLVATDCNRLLEAAVDIHYLWSAPLEGKFYDCCNKFLQYWTDNLELTEIFAAIAIVILLIILTGYSALIGLGKLLHFFLL